MLQAVHNYHVKTGAAGIRPVHPELIFNIDSEPGACMYYDRHRARWRRVGKAASDGDDACFQGRHKGHIQKLKAKSESEFYRKFPLQGYVNPAFQDSQKVFPTIWRTVQ